MNRVASLLHFAKNHVAFYHRRAPDQHLILANWPLTTKHDLAEHSVDSTNDLLSVPKPGIGYVFASGGTTAKPIYSFYTHEEMRATGTNISMHLMGNGMEPGDRVANYFGAGDMSAAFLLADKVLAALPVTILPLGFTHRMDYSVEILGRFKPSAILGIPSILVSLARHCQAQNTQIQIPKVFYGGEAITAAAADVLVSIWRSELIRSASYAATEVGAIGWQCLHCNDGEHYPFNDTVVEIIDDEIVVTSLTRRAMPLIRYRTGDRGEWLTPSCDCGHGAPLFRLLGRTDNAIIIWGCWVLYDDLVEALEDLNIAFTAVQAHIFSKDGTDHLRLSFESLSQLESNAGEVLRDRVYQRCTDLSATVPREMLDSHLFFKAVPIGALSRNERTGKVTPIIDSRF